MKHQYSLKIESPCSENWNEMLPTDMGKFCLHCQKTVIDFSEMTDYEIAMYLHQHKNEEICGNVRHSQSHKNYEYIESHLVVLPVKRYVIMALATFMVATPNMLKSQNTPLHATENKANQVSQSPQNQLSTPLKNSISGKLINQKTGKPIGYAKITLNIRQMFSQLRREKEDLSERLAENANPSDIKAIEQEIGQIEKKFLVLDDIFNEFPREGASTTTDENGYFSLSLPDSLREMDIMLGAELQYSAIKNAEGEEAECYENSINIMVLYFKGGEYYKELKVKIEPKDRCSRGRVIVRTTRID